MGPRQGWIWNRDDWPAFRWDASRLATALAVARLAQGKALGAARLLDPDLTLEAVAAILTEDGLTTSAIEGERLAPDVVRSSVARHLGLPTAGLPVCCRVRARRGPVCGGWAQAVLRGAEGRGGPAGGADPRS